MHLLRVCGLALSLTSITVVSARRDDGRVHANMVKPAAVPLISAPDPSIPVKSRNGTELPPYTTTFYFDQLIDHKNPSLGTFKQRFWHTWEFYETGEFLEVTSNPEHCTHTLPSQQVVPLS